MPAHKFAVLLGLISMICAGGTRAEDGPNSSAPPGSASGAGETLKERLSDKASDDQRVNNCKVPLNRRGAKIRPDTCGHDAAAPSTESPVTKDTAPVEALGPHR
jgi:hypothetical protein